MRREIPSELIRFPSSKQGLRSNLLCVQGWFLKGYSVFITQGDDAEISSILIKTRHGRKRQLKIKGPLKDLNSKGLKTLGLVVKSLRGLNKLNLDFHNANDFHMNIIRSAYGHLRLKELKINLSRGFLPDETFYKILDEISGLRLLKVLDLSFKKCYNLNSRILLNFDQSLLNLRYLKTLRIDLNNLGGSSSKTFEDFFAAIHSLKSLQKLHLDAEFCHLSVKAIDNLLFSLSNMPKIYGLKLGLSTLPVLPLFPQLPTDLKTEIPNIKYLALTGRGRYQRSFYIAFLARIQHITKLNLDLAYTTVSNNDLKEIKGYIAQYTHLDRLMINLSFCTQLKEEGLIRLFEIIKGLKFLRSVKLEFRQVERQKIFTTKSIQVLGNSLIRLEKLKKLFLHFGGPNIKKRDFINISEWLKHLTDLTALSLGFDDSRRCSEYNFLLIQQVISNMKKLNFLELCFDECTLHDESLQLLSETLLQLKDLRVMFIKFRKYTYFSPNAVLKFRNNVTSNHHLKKRTLEFTVKMKRKLFARESVLLLLTIIIPLTISFLLIIYFAFVL